MLALYATPVSANARKPLALIEHLGLDVETCAVNVYLGEGQRPEFLAINPDGKVPVLVDGDFVLTESNAILCYLAARAGATELTGSCPQERADVVRWLFWEASAWQPAIVEVLYAHVAHRLLPDVHPAVENPPNWNAAGLSRCLSRLESNSRSYRFLTGEGLTLADFAVAGMMTFFRAYGFPFEAYPRIASWYAEIEALPAWQRSSAAIWEVS